MNSSAQTRIASAVLAAEPAERVGRGDACAEWLARLQSDDEEIRSHAWFNAGPMGAAGVSGAAFLITNPKVETARAATRALQQIVRYVGRPGADKERKAVVKVLLPLLGGQHAQAVRVTALLCLSEIGGDEAVKPIAALLVETQVREAARMALERLPGPPSLAALTSALGSAPEDFKPALAQSIRSRGGEVPNIPDAKLVPCKPTRVQPWSTSNRS